MEAPGMRRTDEVVTVVIIWAMAESGKVEMMILVEQLDSNRSLEQA
jgi:hypothetical protein